MEITRVKGRTHCFDRFMLIKSPPFIGNVDLIRDICRDLFKNNIACKEIFVLFVWISNFVERVDAGSPQTLNQRKIGFHLNQRKIGFRLNQKKNCAWTRATTPENHTNNGNWWHCNGHPAMDIQPEDSTFRLDHQHTFYDYNNYISKAKVDWVEKIVLCPQELHRDSSVLN